MQTDPKKLRTGRGQGRVAPLLAALALGMALPLAAQAAEPMRVVRDPVTGELRAPTAAELAVMKRAEAAQRAKGARAASVAATPAEIVYPDGTVETPLGEESQMASVVRANDDGTLSMACLPVKQAQAWVQNGGQKPAATKPGVRKSTAKGHEGHNHD